MLPTETDPVKDETNQITIDAEDNTLDNEHEEDINIVGTSSSCSPQK